METTITVLHRKGKNKPEDNFKIKAKLAKFYFTKKVEVELKFSQLSFYDFLNEDQDDWNKCFGWSKGWLFPTLLPRIVRKDSNLTNYTPSNIIPLFPDYALIPVQHHTSQRVVWRFTDNRSVQVTDEYRYKDFKRIQPKVFKERSINNGEVSVKFTLEKPTFAYFNLTPYFGGNRVPNNDVYYVMKVKSV